LKFLNLHEEINDQMAYLLITWLILFIIPTSIGNLFYILLFKLRETSFKYPLNVFQIFWIGFGILITVIQFYSLVLPVNTTCQLIIIGFSIIGLPFLWTIIKKKIRKFFQKGWYTRYGKILFLLISAVIILWISNLSSTSNQYSYVLYDTDLYHYSIVRWINEFPAVPGLCNLHARLAIPSAFLLFSGWVDNGWWDLRSAWIVNPFLLIIVTSQWLRNILIKDDRIPLRTKLFCILTLPYFIVRINTPYVSLYYDAPAFYIQMVLFLEILSFSPLFLPKKIRSSFLHDFPGRYHFQVMIIGILGVLSFLFKSTGIISLIVSFIILSAFIIAFLQVNNGKPIIRKAVILFLLPVLMIAGYVTRNVIQTGWLFYPAPYGNMRLQWSMSKNPVKGITDYQSVRGQYEVIKGWAKIPNYKDCPKPLSLRSDEWIPIWLRNNMNTQGFRWLIVGCSLSIFSLAMLIYNGKKPSFRMDFILWIWTILNVIFWFLMAPDMRFGEGFFWIMIGYSGSLIICTLVGGLSLRYSLSFACMAALLLTSKMHLHYNRHMTFWEIGKASAHPFKAVTLKNGQNPPLTIFVPRTGDRCGDAPLPCTPYHIDLLKLRKPGNLRYGFYIEKH